MANFKARSLASLVKQLRIVVNSNVNADFATKMVNDIKIIALVHAMSILADQILEEEL